MNETKGIPPFASLLMGGISLLTIYLLNIYVCVLFLSVGNEAELLEILSKSKISTKKLEFFKACQNFSGLGVILSSLRGGVWVAWSKDSVGIVQWELTAKALPSFLRRLCLYMTC